MLQQMMVACAATLVLASGAWAQDAVKGPSGACESQVRPGKEAAQGRDAVATNAACLAFRGVMPGAANAPLSRQELVSIILISTLQS